MARHFPLAVLFFVFVLLPAPTRAAGTTYGANGKALLAYNVVQMAETGWVLQHHGATHKTLVTFDVAIREQPQCAPYAGYLRSEPPPISDAAGNTTRQVMLEFFGSRDEGGLACAPYEVVLTTAVRIMLDDDDAGQPVPTVVTVHTPAGKASYRLALQGDTVTISST